MTAKWSEMVFKAYMYAHSLSSGFGLTRLTLNETDAFTVFVLITVGSQILQTLFSRSN